MEETVAQRVLWNSVGKYFAKLTGKTLYRTLCRSTACNYFKKRINHKFFRAYFRNFIQKTFFQSTSWGLLHFAYISIVCICIYKYVEISLSAKLFIGPNKYTNLKAAWKRKPFLPSLTRCNKFCILPPPTVSRFLHSHLEGDHISIFVLIVS